MTDSQTSSVFFSTHSNPSNGGTSSFLRRIKNCTPCIYRNHKQTRTTLCYENRPRRLQNLGSTCYFNATIQALAHSRQLTDWVNRNPTCHMFFETHNGKTLFGWSILRLLEDLSGSARDCPHERDGIKSFLCYRKNHRRRRKKFSFFSTDSSSKRSKSSGNGSLATKEAVISMRDESVSSLLKGTSQHDSHDFLKLIYTCITAVDVSQIPQRMGKLKRTPFTSLITGETTTKRTCTKCGHVTSTVELWTDLSVPVRGNKTLLDGLTEQFAKMHLNGDNAYDCRACGERLNAIHEVNPTKLPPVLTLQLYRFGIREEKVIKLLDCIDIPSFFTVSTATQEHSYTLFAVVCHVGFSKNCGHYVSYVKNKSSKWFKCNDMIIAPISEERIIDDVLDPSSEDEETPYLLLYEITKTECGHK